MPRVVTGRCHPGGMTYDEDLADRVRGLLPPGVEATEKRMFGGLAFLVGGHMAVAASGQGGLMIRCDPAETERLLAEPGAGPMEMRGRLMADYLRIAPEGYQTAADLKKWVARAVDFVATLPKKATTKKAPAKKVSAKKKARTTKLKK